MKTKLLIALLALTLNGGAADLDDLAAMTAPASDDFMWIIDKSDVGTDAGGEQNQIPLSTLATWFWATPSVTGTMTWSSTPVLESGATFSFGDGTDATLTHTYANTGTDVDIAYSTGAMAVTGNFSATGSLTAISLASLGELNIGSSAGADVAITPNTTGDLILDSQKWPQADGTAGYVLKTDGAAQLSWVDILASPTITGTLEVDTINDITGGAGTGVAIEGVTFLAGDITTAGDLNVADLNANQLLFAEVASVADPTTGFGAFWVNSTGSVPSFTDETNASFQLALTADPVFVGTLAIGDGATASGILRIDEDSTDGTNFASFQVPALTANTVYTLPPDDGDSGEILRTDGAGVLTWVADGGGAIGQNAAGSIYISSPAATSNETNTPIKVAGTTAAAGPTTAVTQATTNRLTYTGSVTQAFLVTGSISCTASAATSATFYFYEGGDTLVTGSTITRNVPITDEGAIGVQGIVTLAQNEYVELWCETDDGDDITAQTGNLALIALDDVQASLAFSSLTAATNTTAAMVVGTGASLAASGSGTIVATSTTGNAATVTTITGLAPDTATTQATQASITTAANLVTVGALNAGSITSGFTSIDVGAGAITTTGAVSATNFVATGVTSQIPIFTEAHATGHILTDTECYGSVYYVTGAATEIQLPNIVAGMSLTIIADAAITLQIAPDTGDTIRLDGADLTASNELDSSGTIGDICVLTYHSANKWYATTGGGTWVDGGAAD